MCQFRRYVRNPHTGQYLLTDCGKCPSCQQKKAARRATRIRNNGNGNLCLFVTLTYDNAGVPYFELKDLVDQVNSRVSVGIDGRKYFKQNSLDDVHIPIYRNCTARRVRSSADYVFSSRRSFGKVEIADYQPNFSDITDYDLFLKSLNRFRGLKHMRQRVGVCYYPDLQMFMKRLRQNLKRVYGFTKDFQTFQCSEYGGYSHRPHFHLLMFIPWEAEATFRSAIVESWPFGNKFKGGRFIEIARNAASYVASYVNGNNSLSPLLEGTEFEQKHSYSKSFGIGLDVFQLPQILEKVRNRSLFYTSERNVDGKTVLSDVPIPKYVINRYFPLFKGFSNLNTSEISECLECPEKLLYKYNLDYTPDDLHKVQVRLAHCYQYYNSLFDRPFSDFIIDYNETWSAWRSYVLQHSYDIVSDPIDWLSFFDNGGILNYRHISPSLTDYLDTRLERYYFNFDPTNVLGLRKEDSYLENLYYKKSKYKAAVNHVMSEGLGLDV